MLSFLPGNAELIIVLVVAVLLFGSRLPKIARNMGQAQKEFKKGLAEGAKDDQSAPPAAPPSNPSA